MSESTKTEIQNAWRAQGIRKVVWEGRYLETDEGRVIRGAVGLTYRGDFKAAEVTLYEERGPNGRASFSAETYQWDKKAYSLKEQAIFAAQSKVGDTRSRDSRESETEERLTSRTTNAAAKYGRGTETVEDRHLGRSR
jgi:hypothetical protein